MAFFYGFQLFVNELKT